MNGNNKGNEVSWENFTAGGEGRQALLALRKHQPGPPPHLLEGGRSVKGSVQFRMKDKLKLRADSRDIYRGESKGLQPSIPSFLLALTVSKGNRS